MSVSKVENKNHNLSNPDNTKILSNSFVLLSVIISFTTTGQSIGIANADVFNTIQAIFLLFVILYDLAIYNLEIRFDFVIYIIFLLLLVGINEAPYMFSLLMMLMLIMMVELYGDKIEFDKVLKAYAITSICLFICVIVAYFLFDFNIDKNVSMWRIDKIINRATLGFTQPNVTAMNWFAIVITLMGIYRSRFNQLILIMLTLLIYKFTLSRTSTIIILSLLLCTCLLGKKQDMVVPKLVKYVVAVAPFIFFLISLSFILKSNFSVELNTLLSGRLTLYRKFYNIYGIHFLSTPQLENAVLDNSYLQALLSKGIWFCCALLTIYFKLGIFSKKMTWKTELIYLSILFLGVTETALQHFDLFFPLVMIIGKFQFCNKLR